MLAARNYPPAVELIAAHHTVAGNGILAIARSSLGYLNTEIVAALGAGSMEVFRHDAGHISQRVPARQLALWDRGAVSSCRRR